MSPGSEVPYSEVSEQTDSTADRSEWEARLREAQPFEVVAANQMHDTTVHTQADEPDSLRECAPLA